MYYEFVLKYSDGAVSTLTVMDYEYSDQIAYCNEGLRAGWLLEVNSTAKGEEY